MNLEDLVILHSKGKASYEDEQVLFSHIGTWRLILDSLLSAEINSLKSDTSVLRERIELMTSNNEHSLSDILTITLDSRIKKSSVIIERYRRSMESVDRLEMLRSPDHPQRYKALDFLREAILTHKKLTTTPSPSDTALWAALDGKTTIFEQEQ